MTRPATVENVTCLIDNSKGNDDGTVEDYVSITIEANAYDVAVIKTAAEEISFTMASAVYDVLMFNLNIVSYKTGITENLENG